MAEILRGGVILKAEVAVAQEALLQAEHPVEAQANQAKVEALELAVLVHQEAQAVELEAAEALAQAVAVAQEVLAQAVKLKP